jgi:hypothetical protein
MPPGMSCSTSSDLATPFIYRPPSRPSSPLSEPILHTPLLGVPGRLVDLLVIHHLEEILANEQSLDLVLGTVIGCTRPPVAISEVRQ